MISATVAELEAEALYILREAAAAYRRAVLLFSGGKDSITLLHLALKAFHPAPIPFALLHVDTGHNFPEALDMRDALVRAHGLTLHVAKVEDTLQRHGLPDVEGKFPSRNALQSQTLMDAIRDLGLEACIGGGRRDEEKARAKERIFSLRGAEGRWEPERQRAELWSLYNPHLPQGAHMRVFPLSNWTEWDVWAYIAHAQIALPSLYYAHERRVMAWHGKWVAENPWMRVDPDDVFSIERVRYRTVGDMTCTAAVRSEATTALQVLQELETARFSERGQTRLDDTFSPTAMEDRKRQGYF